MNKTNLKTKRSGATPFFKRVFRDWKSTIARLFLFALCASAIIALAIASQNKSFDKLPTERSVASRSLPVNAADVVAVDETVASAEPLTETVELAADEAPVEVETESSARVLIADIQSDEQEEIAFADDDVSEEAPVVATTPNETASEVAEVAQCASKASVELRPISIREIRIGDRVPGENPEGSDGSDEALFASEDLYIFTFRVPKEDGTFCKAKLLRSESWLYDQQARFASVVDGHEFNEIDALLSERSPEYFDLNFQLEVWLEMPELGCVGWAKIVDVDDTFEYVPGEGNLVTGTFEHIAQETIDLQIEGQEKPIGCTPTHPIWSEDREEFVSAGDLFEGERVRVLNGDTKRVVQKLPRPGPEVVYNIEVFGEHVYHVTSDGVLVHNGCPKRSRRYTVYYALDEKGNVSYIGRTNNYPRRKLEQAKNKRDIKEIFTDLTYRESRVLEDMLIRPPGIKSKGGLLDNEINGMSEIKRRMKKNKNFRRNMRPKIQDLINLAEEAEKSADKTYELPNKVVELLKTAIEYDKTH